MKEFPVWNSAVTSHIASHVKIKSIRCVECCLSFASKDALMSHLRSSHTRLPEGICIDVSIENHERRHLNGNTDILPDSENSVSSKDPCAVEKVDCSEKTPDAVSPVNKEKNVDRSKRRVSGDHGMKAESDRCSSVSDFDVESCSSVSLEDGVHVPVSRCQSDMTKDSSANSPATKTSRRKSRKPSHVSVNNARHSEIVDEDGYSWVEIVAATQPMTARCPHCTFTCNTELQLKVQCCICKHCYFHHLCTLYIGGKSSSVCKKISLSLQWFSSLSITLGHSK